MKLCRVKGHSMHPVLRDNDLVVLREAALTSLRRGNILIYREDSGEYVAHRFIRKGRGGRLCLKGDCYGLPLEKAEEDAIMGKAIGFIRNGRYVPLGRSIELCSWFVSSFKECAKRWIRDPLRLWGH